MALAVFVSPSALLARGTRQPHVCALVLSKARLAIYSLFVLFVLPVVNMFNPFTGCPSRNAKILLSGARFERLGLTGRWPESPEKLTAPDLPLNTGSLQVRILCASAANAKLPSLVLAAPLAKAPLVFGASTVPLPVTTQKLIALAAREATARLT